jgi:hypothetical protein
LATATDTSAIGGGYGAGSPELPDGRIASMAAIFHVGCIQIGGAGEERDGQCVTSRDGVARISPIPEEPR